MKVKYEIAYLNMAEEFGLTSESTRKKVGVLIVKGDCIIAQGVNGQPPGWHTEVCEGEDGLTLPTVRHAEIAALEKLWNSPNDCTGATLYTSLSPCKGCSIKIASSGITKVVFKHQYRCTEGIDYLLGKGVQVFHLKGGRIVEWKEENKVLTKCNQFGWFNSRRV